MRQDRSTSLPALSDQEVAALQAKRTGALLLRFIDLVGLGEHDDSDQREQLDLAESHCDEATRATGQLAVTHRTGAGTPYELAAVRTLERMRGERDVRIEVRGRLDWARALLCRDIEKEATP